MIRLPHPLTALTLRMSIDLKRRIGRLAARRPHLSLNAYLNELLLAAVAAEEAADPHARKLYPIVGGHKAPLRATG